MKYIILSIGSVRGLAGYVYNEGPPHDRNYNWIGSSYVEMVHPTVLMGDFDTEIRVLVDDEGKPLEFQGKWILDTYLLLPKENQVK